MDFNWRRCAYLCANRLGDFSFMNAYMSQPKTQLETFRACLSGHKRDALQQPIRSLCSVAACPPSGHKRDALRQLFASIFNVEILNCRSPTIYGRTGLGWEELRHLLLP